MDQNRIIENIEDAVRQFSQAMNSQSYSILPVSLTSGKLYEAYTLSTVLRNLYVNEGFRIVLRNDNFMPLKMSPGPINRRYPYFEIYRNNSLVAELWTDVEFISMSYVISREDRYLV